MKGLLLVTTMLTMGMGAAYARSMPSPAVTVHNQPPPCVSMPAAPSYAAASGGFAMIDGQMYDPSGNQFQARGINIIAGSDQAKAMTAPDMFRGLNYVRLAVLDYADPAKLQPLVDSLTARGVVVEIENHNNGAGNAGGGRGPIFTGAQLEEEQAWYSKVAGAFKNNPYVWFGTNNEPPGPNAELADWQKRTYDTIRKAGNNNPIAISAAGWDAASMMTMPADRYAGMTNTFIDLHYYGWLPKYSTDQATVDKTLADVAAGAQKLQNRDGKMPVLIGEFGDSTDGIKIDQNGTQVVKAVLNSGLGYAAWAFAEGLPGDGLLSGGKLSGYGQTIAANVSSSGSPGCAQSPIANPVLFDASGNVLPVSGSIADTVLQAMNGSKMGQSDTSSVDITATLASMNQGPKVAGPQGTFTPPTPPDVPASALVVSTDFGKVMDTSGAHVMTVTGTGNTISATSGPQTVTVSSPGNAIRLGAFNDTVTLTSSGNTVDGGGGTDTVTLAYSNASTRRKSSKHTETTTEIPTVNAALSAAGNTIIAPAPGMGVLTINGTLAPGDKIDMTKALAGTTWNHQPSTMWQYMDAAATADGCVVTVGGKVVVRLPDGSPGDNIGPFISGS